MSQGHDIDFEVDLRARAKNNLSLKPPAEKVTTKCVTPKAAWEAYRLNMKALLLFV